MQVNYLFVYGSLLSGFKSPAYEYISRYFKLTGRASIKGTMYDMGDYPVVLPVDTGRYITGELYKIDSPAAVYFALAQLDDYEGIHPNAGEEALYKRSLVDVRMDDQIIQAWVYWHNKEIADKPIVESGDSLDYFLNK